MISINFMAIKQSTRYKQSCQYRFVACMNNNEMQNMKHDNVTRSWNYIRNTRIVCI